MIYYFHVTHVQTTAERHLARGKLT